MEAYDHVQGYRVEGRAFADGGQAVAFARILAAREGREISVMEKVDGLPWHRVATMTPDQ